MARSGYPTFVIFLACLGIVFLLAGLMSAALVYPSPAAHSEAADYRPDQPAQMLASKERIAELRAYGGDVAVIIGLSDQKLRDLMTRKNLARILTISGFFLAAACFAGAWRLQKRL